MAMYPQLNVVSAGFKPSTRRAAKKVRDWMSACQGISLERHVPQKVTQEMIEWAEVVVYMDGGNHNRLLDFDVTGRRVECLGTSIGKDRIRDPAFVAKDSPEFRAVMEEIVQASHALAKELLK